MTQEIRDAVARAATICEPRADDWPIFYETDCETPYFTVGHLRALVTALSACEPTPEMVEAGAEACVAFLESINSLSENAGMNVKIEGWVPKRDLARAAVSAALKMVGK